VGVDLNADQIARPARRLWMYLLAAAGAAVVVLSWTVPEPEPSNANPATANPAQRIGSVSYTQCLKQDAPMPNYGARTMSYTTCS